MLYSILKDDNPKNTVNRIKKILKDLNIELQKKFFINNDESAPVSVRVHLKDNICIGTNGKGTCKENAMASAYAEFMERLQNLILYSFEQFCSIIPDKIDTGIKIKFDNDSLNQYFKNKILVYKKIKNQYKDFDNFFYCPFYSVKNQKVYNLPYNIISRVNGSNGMAAGNTVQEAIVQALSEICERYSLKEILLNNYPMKDIPEDEYLKYDNIAKIINYYKNNGFNIYIKDASLNGKVPVICSVFEDTKKNLYTVSFGAHPSFPIAVERTLTEFLQGIVLSKTKQFNNLSFECYSSTKLKYTSLKNIYKAICHKKVLYEKTSKLDKIFFNNELSYEFSKKAWIKESDDLDNKKLLDFLSKKVLNISDDIYIRNVDFLGFPSVYIFVPNMSDIMGYTKQELMENLNDFFWLEYNQNPDKKYYNIETLLKLSETYSFLETSNSKVVFDVTFEYIALLCSIVLKDSNKIIKYIDIIFSQNKYISYFTSEQLLTFKIIKDYYTYIKKHKYINYIMGELTKKYKKKDLDYAIDIINELTYEMIINIIIKNKKNKVFNNKKLIQKLNNAYRNNTPNQLNLREIFS